MARWRPRKKKINLDNNAKKWIFASFFLLFWIIIFIAKPWTKFEDFLINFLTKSFWEYYKIIVWVIFIFLWWFLIKEKYEYFDVVRAFWLILFLICFTSLFGIFSQDYNAYFNFYNFLIGIISKNISILFFISWILLSLYLLFRISYLEILNRVWEKIWNSVEQAKKSREISRKEVYKMTKTWLKKQKSKKTDEFELKQEEIKKAKEALEKENKKLFNKKDDSQLNINDIPKKINLQKPETKKIIVEKKEKDCKSPISVWKWDLPSINLLSNRWWKIKFNKSSIEHKMLEIQEKLLQFRISVEMESYRVWPTVIQFRLKPNKWVKLNKIENLKKDLTLALHAKSIRIQAPIPWEWVVWIEVPNENRAMVWLKEIIASRDFNSWKYDIPLAFWKDVNGDVVVWDLARMPHMLIAGQTWSWKSVWMNGFIISMLYKFSPDELKFIMIDPKRVELSIYNWIPHLLVPVITSPDKALNSLKWAVAEMLRRYDLATQVWARNLKEYNAKVSKKEKLPYIVIIIDELADLMMSGDKKEVEWAIARIAQMARAVWMHLMIATQRPSVDVLTWLIKANIPSRVAFTVASQIDSRTVLDKMGAEDLLGMWDMLYYPTWAIAPKRVQWVYVDTAEVEAVVKKLKLTIDPETLEKMQDSSIVNGKSNFEWSIMEGYEGDMDEDPEIVEKAIEVIKQAKKGSTSLIQRKLWLGYARAAKILDILEEMWIVGPSNWSKPREVYID